VLGREAVTQADDTGPLRVRWLGTVPYREAHDLQRRLFEQRRGDWLLLLEHPPTYTMGVRTDPANILVPPDEVGAELVRSDRGGDVTFHGPGQLVAYPILDVPGRCGGGMTDTVAYVRTVEQVVIDAVQALGVSDVGRLDGFPGVWVAADSDRPRKLAAIGVRLVRGRSMHGFALNVDPDLGWFDHIVPCGLVDKPVTSLAAEGIDASMGAVVEAVIEAARPAWGHGGLDRAEVAWKHRPDDLSPFSHSVQVRPDDLSVDERRPSGTSVRLLGRLAAAGVTDGMPTHQRKPEWLRTQVKLGPEVRATGRAVHDLGLVTVCEEAGCPNLSECWADGTATFMVLGERCTRACGFCLVDTRLPDRPAPDEPDRVAQAVARMDLDHVVLTMVARDDLPDGGAAHVAATVAAVRRQRPGTAVEVLISDLRGDRDALQVVLDASPEVVNHNLETVARLQRAVRPSAGYARSLALLARANVAGAVTKSGFMVGLGETDDEVHSLLADLAGVGVQIVTIGHYLRPTAAHLPVARWVEPEQFGRYADEARALGIVHDESSPLTRSSHHARAAAEAAGTSRPWEMRARPRTRSSSVDDASVGA
jgi:lipoic acid synthetase